MFQYDIQNQMTDIIESIFNDEYFHDMAIKEFHEYINHMYENEKQTILDLASNESIKDINIQEMIADLPNE